MATPKEEYLTEMLDHLNEHNRRNDKPLSSKNLRESVIRVMEEEEKDAKCNVNNVTANNSFQSPVAINAQKKDTNVSYERQLDLGILAETIKEFKRCTIQSTISDSTEYDSEKQVDAINDSDEQVNAIKNSEELVDAGSDPTRNPSSNPKVATYTTNGKLRQNLLRSRFVPEIIQGDIVLINQLVTKDVT